MAETGDQVVVNKAGSLHVGVDYGASYELETPFFKVRTQGVGFFRGGGELRKFFPAVNLLFPADERPYIF